MQTSWSLWYTIWEASQVLVGGTGRPVIVPSRLLGILFTNSNCGQEQYSIAYNGLHNQHLQLLYCSNRSLLPKIDELHALRQPHIVCVVEIRLSNAISDNEEQMPGYQLI